MTCGGTGVATVQLLIKAKAKPRESAVVCMMECRNEIEATVSAIFQVKKASLIAMVR